MDSGEHRAEAERLVEQLSKMTEDYVKMDMDALQPRAQLVDLFVMIGRRAEIHARLSQGE